MDSSAEDGGGLPTALARGPASQDSASPSPGSQVPSLPDSASQSPGAQDSASQVRGTRKPVIPEQRTAANRGPAPAGGEADKPAPRRPTDGVAVAALVSGIVPAIPVTLVLGPLALIRISRSGARGRALAITGLVLAGLWTVAAAVVAAAIITRPPPPKPVTLPHVFSLRAGECLNSGSNGISGLQVLSCSQAHDAEVFATFRVAASHYPGATALQQQAQQGCASRLSGYLNPQLSAASLAQSFVYPDAGAWSAGERTVVCTVRSTSGPLVGSVRSSPG
jgi:Septum formation